MKTKQIEVLFELNEETLQAVTDGVHGARFVFSNKEKCEIIDISNSAIYVKRQGINYLYRRRDGLIFTPETKTKKFLRNYARIRVLMTFDSIEEFRAFDLRTYCVSRHIIKTILEQMRNGGIAISKPRLREHVNTGERVIKVDELHKAMGGQTKPQDNTFAEYLKQFRDLYKELADMQDTTSETAIIAIVFGGLAFLVSLIALIVTMV